MLLTTMKGVWFRYKGKWTKAQGTLDGTLESRHIADCGFFEVDLFSFSFRREHDIQMSWRGAWVARGMYPQGAGI